MISSVSDYLFVVGDNIDADHPHGDLDRIIVDGGIMPLRTGSTGKVDKDGNAILKNRLIMGEDLSFLQEAISERVAAAEGYWPISPSSEAHEDYVRTFSRKIRWLPLLLEYYRLDNDLFFPSRYIKNKDLFVNVYGQYVNPNTYFPSAFYTIADMSSIGSDFPSLSPQGMNLSMSRMAHMFEDVEKCHIFYKKIDSFNFVPSIVSYSESSYTYSGTRTQGSYPYGQYKGEETGVTVEFDGERRNLIIRNDYQATVSNSEVDLVFSGFNYAKSCEVWLNATMTDYDSYRTQKYGDDSSLFYHAFIKLNISPIVISGSNVVLATNFFSNLYGQLKQAAFEYYSSYRPENTIRPFRTITPSEYKKVIEDMGEGATAGQASANHMIGLSLSNAFVVCELRDRTRWSV